MPDTNNRKHNPPSRRDGDAPQGLNAGGAPPVPWRSVGAAADSFLVRMIMTRLDNLPAQITAARLESRRDWALRLEGEQAALEQMLRDVTDRLDEGAR